MGMDGSILEILGKFLHLRHFPQPALERLATISEFKNYKKNEVIYRPRTEKHGAVFIISGFVVGSIQDILSEDERMMVFFTGTPISTDLYASHAFLKRQFAPSQMLGASTRQRLN